MEIGTVEPIIEYEPVRKSRLRLPGGGSKGGNGNNDDGGGDEGGSGFHQSFSPPLPEVMPDKARVITWFLLLVVLMTFGGLIGAYVVVATNGSAEWQPFDLPVQLWISTAVIMLSSITYQLAKRAIDNNNQQNILRYLITTTALGGVFIASQLLAWLALVASGLYVQGNPYAGFFYILTAAHAIHVIGGIVALGAILLRSWYPTKNADELIYRCNLGRSVGWYWHFMGALWIVLFTLLGFWK